MSRVNVYVDGFNLYFGLREARFKRYYWLDLQALATSMLLPGQVLGAVHYFTARLRANGSNADSIHRQSDYLDALASFPALTIHEGHFLAKSVMCHSCGATWTTFEEKMSDVNLAVQLLLDAADGLFDTAIIVSGDSDLSTPVRRVLARFSAKLVLVALPPKRHSAELKRVASGSFSIGEDKLRRCQLPDPMLTSAGVSIHRPALWR